MKTGSNEKAAGIWAVAAAYVSWGLLPLFWRLLDQIPAQKIIAHRIVWSFAFLFILVFFQERWLEIKKIFSSKKTRTTLSLTSLILGMNWFVYIWAVNSGHVVEASLGYFINPLVSVLLGVLFLKEKLNFWQEISVFLAFIGVLYRAVDIGNIPWISLSLALTFGFYGFFIFKKKVNADSIAGLTAEMILLFPLAFVFIILMNIKNMGVIGKVSFPLFMLLLCTGIVTSLPLLCFNYGVKKIELFSIYLRRSNFFWECLSLRRRSP